VTLATALRSWGERRPEFYAMGSVTPCPHPKHLRMLLHGQAQMHEIGSLRDHLEQCPICRAIAERLEAEDPDKNTLADVGSACSYQAASLSNPGQGVRQKNGGTAEQTIALLARSPVDSVEASGATVELTRPSRSAAQPNATSAEKPAVSAEHPDSLAFLCSSVQTDGGSTTDSVMTCNILPGADSSEGGSSFWLATTLRRDSRGKLHDSNRRDAATSGALEHVTVPGYDILAELGRGGMGVVYKARHRGLQRLVALKMVLAGAHVGAVGLARFRAEAEAVAKLSHSNIVQIYETGEYEGRPFFSLELVEGGSLDQRLRESPTSPSGAASLIETLARTMHVAHERGIIHRDLKPANILLGKAESQSSIVRGRETDSQSLPSDHWSRTCVPKIADFGLAKQVDDDSSQTRTGTILGTPSYMAPEQAGGKNREIGPAVDIYALGAILYELLVGRPPFRAGNPIDTIRQVIDQEPVPPRQLEPRVPHDLETICLKCLEKDPARRFHTALDLANDLRRFVDGDPIHARPTPAWERAWKWGRRRKAIVALLAVSVLAVVSMVLFIVWHNVSLRGKLDVAIGEERLARKRELDALAANRLTVVRQEAQKLYDSARVGIAASDWSNARLDLEKALTTIGNDSRLAELQQSAETLLRRVEQELRVEADRRESRARLQSFVGLRDEAQFLGTLYTGMDLAANLKAARAAVNKALDVYGVIPGKPALPKFDTYLSEEQQHETVGDCAQLLLVLAETEAQSSGTQGPAQKERHLRQALSYLEQARQLGAPARAFHLRRARYLNMLRDKAEAARAEKAAGSTAADDVLDHFLIADELYRREQFDAATKAFEKVLERKPGHFWAQYLDALCLLRQQRPAEARALLSACLAQRSDFVWLYLLRGFAQQELEEWGAAETDFQKAGQLRLDDDARYVLLVNRGVLRIRTDRTDDAIADLNAAIKLKPGAYQAFVNLAQAYRRRDKLDLALSQLDRALEREPGLAHLYRLKARLHLERNERDLALASFDQAIERETKVSSFQVDDQIERGRLLLHSGKPALALASFDAALALRSDHSQAQRLRAEALFRLGRFADVVAAFDHYLLTGRPLEAVYRGRGLARAELGQYPGAIDDFTKALELHPTSAVQAFRGWTHLVADAPKLAQRDFELAIELDPKNGDAYNGRGMAKAKLGQYREAATDAAEALRLGPTSPRLYYNAARICAQCPGPYARRALDHLQQALRLLSADERRDFWATHIEKDQSLAVLRHHPSFVRMASDLTRGK
jgi:serine/threonine protein kinase/tetratricopeptide (TPR) repeat protein